MVMDIQIVRDETCCRHMGYSFRLAAMDHLYAPSHKQDSTYPGFCYTSRAALAETKNSSIRDRSSNPSYHERMLYHEATSHFPQMKHSRSRGFHYYYTIE